MRTIGLCLALVVLAPDALSEARPACGLERAVAAIAEQEDFSGTILVTHKAVPVVRLYRGQLSEHGSGSIVEGTRFNLASAGKMFTAVAIGQLIDKGKLRLDEPIGDIVKGLTAAAGQVTIRQLLNHTSGFTDFFKPENLPFILKAQSASELLPLIAKESPAFAPGSRFSYSNSGFLLLGIAVERLSEGTYSEYLRRNVFSPAGMISTGRDPHPLATLAAGMTCADFDTAGPAGGSPGVSPSPSHGTMPGATLPKSSTSSGPLLVAPAERKTHSANAPEQRPLRAAPGAYEGLGSPAGGIFSTASDLNKFALALEEGKLLSKATLDAFTSPQVQVSPQTASAAARYYGFGFGLNDVAGTRWIGHNGGTLGINVEFWFDPAGQWIVAVLSNRDPPVATQMLRQIRPLLSESAETATGCR